MKIQKFGITCACAVALAVALAEDDGPYAGFVRQQTSDSGPSDDSFSQGAHWSDGKAPEQGKRYYVPSGTVFYTPAGNSQDRSFAGDVLACAGDIKISVSGDRQVSWPELWLLDGATYSFGSRCQIGGAVEVKAGNTSPAKYLTYYSPTSVNFSFNASLAGNEDAVLAFGFRSGETIPSSPTTTIVLKGDVSGYSGTLAVEQGQSMSFGVVGGAMLPGAVKVEAGGWFFNPDATVQHQVGTLDLCDGATYSQGLSAGSCKPLLITTALKLGCFNLRLTGAPSPDRTAKRYPVFRLTAAAAANPPDVTNVRLENVLGSDAFPPGQRLEIEDAGDDKVIFFVYDDWVSMWTGNGAGTTSTKSALQQQWAAECWSNRKCPTPDTTGWLSIDTTLLAYNNDDGTKEFSYPNARFLIRSGVVFYCQFDRFAAKEVHFAPGSYMQSYVGSQDKYWDEAGSIVIHGGASPVTYKAREWAKVHLGCSINGTGDLELNADDSDKPGTYYLEGDNSDFGGGFKFFYSDASKANSMNIYVGSSKALGGPTASGAFRPDAVIFGNRTRVTFENTMTLKEITRGWKISGNAVINVPNNLTVEVLNSITYDGTLTKEGGGLLCVAGTARFGNGEPESQPETGRNVLVTSSPIRLLGVDALNGVQLTLNPGSQLQLLLDVEDEFGFRNTKTDTPFAIQTSDGRIPFRWAGSAAGIAQDRDIHLPVCTVRADVAPALVDKLAMAYSPFSRLRFDGYAIRDNGDGSSTIVADFCKQGFALIIR